MIYSGADLIRTSGQQQDKVARLKVVTDDIKPAEKPARAKSSLDEETSSALERFARFLKKKPSQNKSAAPKSHPYSTTLKALENHYDRGQRLDIYV